MLKIRAFVFDRVVWEKRDKRKTTGESILKWRTLRRMRAVHPVIARDFSDLDFRSSLFYRVLPPPFGFPILCAVYLKTLRLAIRRFLPTMSSSNSSILALLVSGLSYVSLIGVRIAALHRDIFVSFILENIW